MSVNMKKMRGDYHKRQKSGEFYQPETGETIVYVCPPCRPKDKYEPTDGLNYIPVTVHYQVGKGNAMVMSLDSEANPIIDHPFLKEFLKKAKKKLTGHCPMREFLENDASEAEAENCRPQTKYLWNVVPIKHRTKKGAEWNKLDIMVRPYLSGKTVYDGIMELFFEIGDITEMDGAILVKIKKSGKGLKTKYQVSADVGSLKKPFVLPAAVVKKIKEALKEGGDCDLFRVAANMVKTPSEVEALLSGVKLDDSDDDDDLADDDDADADDADDESDEEDGDDDADDESDESDEEDDDESDESDEEDDDESDESDEEDDADESDEEDDDESDESDEEDDADDESDEEDGDEDESPPEPAKKRKALPKKGKALPKKGSGKKASSIEDDLAALDAELQAVSKKKPSKNKPKAK